MRIRNLMIYWKKKKLRKKLKKKLRKKLRKKLNYLKVKINKVTKEKLLKQNDIENLYLQSSNLALTKI